MVIRLEFSYKMVPQYVSKDETEHCNLSGHRTSALYRKETQLNK